MNEIPAANHAIADMLREVATLLGAQGANPFRIGAYRRAADAIAALPESVRERFERSGRAGLEDIPGIGVGLSAAIAEMVITGGSSQLERLRGGVDPEVLFRTIPGIGSELAHHLHDELGVDTLEALEMAAHDGRLERVRGVGPRRAAAIRAVLAQMLDRRRGVTRRVLEPRGAAPPVGMLLEVDAEYREKARAGKLPTIAPRRFNASSEKWLPILHARRGEWHFTVLYSNTAQAHALGHVRDWVVIYCYDNDHAERQYTVVTESRGARAGERVVRGREAECAALATAG